MHKDLGAWNRAGQNVIFLQEACKEYGGSVGSNIAIQL